MSTSDDLPVFDAEDLRDLAERAASLRGRSNALFGVVLDGKLMLVPANGSEPPEGALFEIETATVEPRPKVDSLIIRSGDTEMQLAPEFDALFWSESAVEKFLFPYYASKGMWEAASVLSKLSWHWYGRIPVGHGSAPVEVDDIPFAAVHTPDSEYHFLERAPGHELHLLSKGPEGLVAKRLSDLDDPPPGWQARRAAGDPEPQTLAAPDAG